MTSGVHAFEFEVVASKYKNGGCMYIGLADASAAARAGDCGRAVAWGYHPYNGGLRSPTDLVGWHGSGPIAQERDEGREPLASKGVELPL